MLLGCDRSPLCQLCLSSRLNPRSLRLSIECLVPRHRYFVVVPPHSILLLNKNYHTFDLRNLVIVLLEFFLELHFGLFSPYICLESFNIGICYWKSLSCRPIHNAGLRSLHPLRKYNSLLFVNSLDALVSRSVLNMMLWSWWWLI